MPVLLIGCSHRTSPLDFLERVALAPDLVGKTVRSLSDQTHLSEALVLSTCNRVEFYLAAERFHAGYAEARDVLSEVTGVPADELGDHVQIAYDDDAIAHLFRVAAGLESAVVGEHEIVGQLKAAWELSQANGGVGTLINQLARHAIGVAKRARNETAIGRHTASVSQAAVALAAGELAECEGSRGLDGRPALVIGAGDMGRGMVKGLTMAGAQVTLANRSMDRANVVVGESGGRAISLSDLGSAMREADVVLSGTSASDLVLDHTAVDAVMSERDGRPLLVIDVAVPRDVDPAVGMIDGVTLLDMDAIREFVNRSLDLRRQETDAVEGIVAEELGRWRSEVSAREITPTLVKFRTTADSMRQAELQRFESRLAGLDDEQRASVDALTRAIVGKLLHDPTVQLKEAAGTPRGERLLEAARDLHNLGE